MLKQMIKIIRLLGLRRAAAMKKHHEEGLKYIRGYAATTCWWILDVNGVIDRLEQAGSISIKELIKNKGWRPDILDAVLEYLDGIGLISLDGDVFSLTDSGRVLAAEPRGLFELTYAYEPCFANLEALLTGEKVFGRDIRRRITWVGVGSGRLCEQLPYPIMRRMVLDHGRRGVLDLGCGDMALPIGLCRMNDNIRCHGIDFDPDMIAFNHQQLAKQDFNGRLSCSQADMFTLENLPDNLPDFDCITACDTFHEYLQESERIVALLKTLQRRWPNAMFVIGEFCLQNPVWLRRHPTASLEHHLFHQLSRQQIGSAQQWRDIFRQADLKIAEENVFDMIGHGYFALKSA
ncbi:MAG: methyltransferase domain-containing protein [Sedimentisphaerales bacterium]|nr:methyltransferase domain-containing protein [Sedimentisphaerales bacterium]